MTARLRHGIALVAFAGLSAGGAVAITSGRAVAEAATSPEPEPAAEPADPAPTCADPAAMAANANLVRQLGDYRARLDAAERRAKDAESKVAAAAAAPPASLVSSRAEWSRMGREGTIRVRVPCARWDAQRVYVRRARRQGTIHLVSGRGSETTTRAAGAGLSPQELETLTDVFKRAHKRTWQAMRAGCEANDQFRRTIAARSPSDLTDERRVAYCSGALLDVSDPGARAALARAAELQAAGAGLERATSDAQRVAFALTDASASLFDEMARALGREKATRAIDNGAVCLDETLFDLRDDEG